MNTTRKKVISILLAVLIVLTASSDLWTRALSNAYVIIPHEGDPAVLTPRVQFHFISEAFHDNTESGYESLPAGQYQAAPYRFPNKGGTYQTTEILIAGESLEPVKNPDNITIDNGDGTTTDKYFFGWYAVDGMNAANGDVIYTWPVDPEEVRFEQAMTLTAADGSSLEGATLTAGSSQIKWTIDGVSGLATLDAEGTAHVYLAPVYEDYYFVSYHLGTKEDGQLKTSLLARKLVVLGSDGKVTVRIGNVNAPSTNATRFVFAGWETIDSESNPIVYYKTMDTEGAERNYRKELDGTETATTDGYYAVFQESDFSADKSVDLYPVFNEARWIYFNNGKSGNGASYIGARYRITNDDNAGTFYTNFPVSTRPGYELEGWYVDAVLDADGNIKNLTTPESMEIKYFDNAGVEQTVTVERTAHKLVNGDGSLADSTYINSVIVDGTTYKRYEVTDGKFYVYKGLERLTLYAKWTPQNVNYTLLVWTQNADNDGFTLIKYKKDLQAQAGSTITVTPGDTAVTLTPDTGSTTTFDLVSFYPEIQYFHASTSHPSDNNVEIDGDGSTQINVYYDRNLYTLWFFLGRASGGTLDTRTGKYDHTGTYPLTEYTGESGSFWAYTDNVNGAPYGLVGGVYVPLTVSGSNSQTVYYPEWTYTVDNETGTFGLNGDSEYESVTDGTRFERTSSLTAGKDYVIVSTASGTGYALGHSGTSIATDQVTITNGTPNYIPLSEVDSTSVWTASSGSVLKNGNYTVRRTSNNSLGIRENDTYANSYTWTWDGTNNRLKNGNYS